MWVRSCASNLEVCLGGARTKSRAEFEAVGVSRDCTCATFRLPAPKRLFPCSKRYHAFRTCPRYALDSPALWVCALWSSLLREEIVLTRAAISFASCVLKSAPRPSLTIVDRAYHFSSTSFCMTRIGGLLLNARNDFSLQTEFLLTSFLPPNPRIAGLSTSITMSHRELKLVLPA